MPCTWDKLDSEPCKYEIRDTRYKIMTIVVAILAISILVLLHEMGHFFTAKKFNVKIQEFGIGLPPRLFGKKRGETLYSVNALPIGGFVRMEGEETRSSDPRSFNMKPIWQRFLIVAAGVLVFWIIAAVIFTVLGATSGIPMAVDDSDSEGIRNPQVRIIGVAPDSPAESIGIELGDTILSIDGQRVDKVGEVIDLIQLRLGQEVVLGIQRSGSELDVTLVPRVDPPADQGAMGVALARSAQIRYEWYQAPYEGVVLTGQVTWAIIKMMGTLVSNLIGGQGLPPGAQLSGPVGVIGLLSNTFALGIPSFLFFIALISIYLAIFNSLPIPALDGGRMFFILLEGVRRKPLSQTLEQRLILASFMILIPFIVWVTIGDVIRLL